jgi:hypothetical protein
MADADKARVVGIGVERSFQVWRARQWHSTHDACDPKMAACIAEQRLVFCPAAASIAMV